MLPCVAMGEPVTFAVDRMLGRLARWLRILGHDVAYGPQLSGRALAACARREGRLLVTRDTRLVRDPDVPPHVFITSDRFREQLAELARVVPLGAGFLGRCLDCNRPLERVAKESIAGRVPPFVYATQEVFHRCPRCGRLYWAATHRARMLSELQTMGLGEAAAAAEEAHG